MHLLVPKFILKQVQQGNQYGALPAAGLFVDLSGFSAMTNTLMQLGQHGAEVMAGIMRQIFTPMIEKVYRHHGFIATFAGDSFTAIFPLDPETAQPNLHPIAAALEIQQTIDGFQSPETPMGTFSIYGRIGVSAGTANWGIITAADDQRATYFFRGSAIEGCIHAQSHAQNGEIILDEAAHTRYGNLIQLTQVENVYRLESASGPLPVTEEIPDTPFDLEIAKRFYPESLLTQDPMGEFRHVVNMFISLPTIRTEPQLEIFLQTLFTLQDRYGGLLNRIDFGDKGAHLLLFWGAPVAYQNDIGRALNFILSLQSETSIPINAGVTYQIAHAGFIGSSLREEYTCYGKGVNLAARFMTSAPRGEVWLDEPIYKRVGHYYEIEFEGAFNFKGFDEKQKVFALYERHQSVDAILTRNFSGREQELKRLGTLFQPIEQGQTPTPAILAGEPGIGKSRLADYFLSKLLPEDDLLLARCQTDQMLRKSFNPFRYWAKNYFNVQDANADARNKRNFNRRLDQLIEQTDNPALATELDRTRSFLGSLVNLFWDDSLYEQLEPQGRYENTIIGLTTLLKAESLLHPIVLLIEDLQWMDVDSKAFLQHLYRGLHAIPDETFPIFILATTREPQPTGCLGEDVPYEVIPLPPLSRTEIQQIATSFFDGAAINPQFFEMLTDFSEGNPLYTEQIIRYLQEDNQLVQTASGWGLIQENTSYLPTDTRAVLVARLDQLPLPVKQVILTAAALGREFNTQILGHMLHQDAQLSKKLGQAEHAAIWTPISQTAYTFNSNLFRDAAYQMQTHAQRQQVHALAVEALEESKPQELAKNAPELAYHAENAGLIMKARQYYQLAGETAQQAYQNQQAIHYFTKALTLSKDLTPDVFLGDLYLARENIYNLIGQRKAQQQDLQKAQTIANQFKAPRLQAQVFNRLSRYHHLIGEYPTAIQNAQEALAVAQKHLLPEVEASSWNAWANSCRHLGEHANAMDKAARGLEIAQQHRDSFNAGVSLNVLSLMTIEQGQFTKAIDLLHNSLETARGMNNFALEAQTLNNLGIVYGELGDYSSAYQAYTQSQEISQKIGSRLGEGFTTSNLGWIAGQLGNYKTAKTHLEKSIRISQEIGEPYIHAFSLLNLSLFTPLQEEAEAARAYAEDGLALLRETGHKTGEAYALTYLGHALTALGQYEEAKDSYRQAYQIRHELDQVPLSMEPLAGLAEITSRTEGADAALPQVEKISAYLKSGGTLDGIDQPFRIYAICARVLMESPPPAGEKFVQQAYTLLQEKATKIQDAPSRESFLSNVPSHRAITDLYHKISSLKERHPK